METTPGTTEWDSPDNAASHPEFQVSRSVQSGAKQVYLHFMVMIVSAGDPNASVDSDDAAHTTASHTLRGRRAGQI